jgi:CIC family chloride channel protein
VTTKPDREPAEHSSGPPTSSSAPSSATRTPLAGGARPQGARRNLTLTLRRLRSTLRLWRLYWLKLEVRLVPTQAQRLFALTLVIGVMCGLAAVAFHLTIHAAELALIERAMAAPGRTWIVWTILTPTIGGLLCGALLTYVVPDVRGSGIPQVKAAFALRGRRVRLRDSFGKFVLASLQIGSGASLGREGPTVQICAGIATALGRAAGVSPKSLRRLLPVGVAAGIAAAFNAPIAAVTFTIEEIVGDLDKSVLSGVIIAAALAAVIERSLLGEHAIFDVPLGYGLHHASSLLVYALLGIAAALVSVAFTDLLLGLRRRFNRPGAIPTWTKPGIGGLATGLLAVTAIALIDARGVTGGGYDTLSKALHGQLAVRVMVVLCVLKVGATVMSYSTGGAGGIFAPSLFVGGMLGGAMGALDIYLFQHEHDTLGAFALVGMGAVFSGIIRAPMTSVLIIIEMTNGYSLILPLMIANMTSYGLARKLRPTPIYEALLEQDGIVLRDRAVMDVLEEIRVGDVLVHEGPLATFELTTGASEMLASDGAQEVYPVNDAAGKLVGLVTTEELDMLRAEPELDGLVNAADLMRAIPRVRNEDDLRTALETMVEGRIRRLPVVDAEDHVIGLIDESAIATAYLRGQGSMETAFSA